MDGQSSRHTYMGLPGKLTVLKLPRKVASQQSPASLSESPTSDMKLLATKKKIANNK